MLRKTCAILCIFALVVGLTLAEEQEEKAVDNKQYYDCRYDSDCQAFWGLDYTYKCCWNLGNPTCCQNECFADIDCIADWIEWTEWECCYNPSTGYNECCDGEVLTWIEQNTVAFAFIIIGSFLFCVLVGVLLCCFIPGCALNKKKSKTTVVHVQQPPPSQPAQQYPYQADYNNQHHDNNHVQPL